MGLNTGILSLSREVKLTEDEFRKLAKFVYDLLGIHIPEKRRYLFENRLSDRLRELSLSSFSDYLNYLRFDTGRHQELDRLIERVTTNETSFFRDTSQLDIFRDKLLPNVIAARLKQKLRRIRVWSAGCSSGEEPYTLAIMILEKLGPAAAQWDIRVLGSDISEAMLGKAREGVYSNYSLRTTPDPVLKRYFQEKGGNMGVHEALKKLVRFERINLTDSDSTRRVSPADIIFCRNVIIYFDDDVKRRVAAAFRDKVASDGYLVLGHSESLRNITRSFLPMPGVGSPIYVPAGSGSDGS